MFLSALAFFLVPVVFQLVSAQTCSRNYTVQPGDICDSISAAHNVSTYQLAAVNNGTIDLSCDNLVPGESICLGWQGEDCATTHVVQYGDDCYDIINANSLNQTVFYANNPQVNSDCTNLYVGEVVCTSSTAQAPPPPANGTFPAPAPSNSPPSLPWCD